MTVDTGPGTQVHDASDGAGTVALVLGVLFVVSTVLVFLMSLTSVIGRSNWIRVPMTAGIPLGLFGVPIAYVVARKGSGRRRGRLGLALVGVALVPFTVLLLTG